MGRSIKPGDTVVFRLPKSVDKQVKWLNNQTNINSAIIYALENYINSYGSYDVSTQVGIVKISDIRCYILVYMYNSENDKVSLKDIYNYILGNYITNDTKTEDIVIQKDRIRQALFKLVDDNIVESIGHGYFQLKSK